jgi:hypothetical protein
VRTALKLRSTIEINRIKNTMINTLTPMNNNLKAAEVNTKMNRIKLEVSQRATDIDPNLQNTTVDNRNKLD